MIMSFTQQNRDSSFRKLHSERHLSDCLSESVV